MRGFTLVELIMVILLVGILAAVGSTLFSRQEGFSAFIASDKLAALLLLAQKRALANIELANVVTLSINQGDDRWTVSLNQGGALYAEEVIERSGATLQVDGTLLANGDDVSISFNSDAEVGVNRQFVFIGNRSYALCLSSTGFVYAGICQS